MNLKSNPATCSSVPLRLGSYEEFSRVATVLRAARFDVETVCHTLGLASIADVGKATSEVLDRSELPERLGLFSRLFLLTDRVPRAEVEQVLDPAALNAFLSLDLIRLGEFSGVEQYYAPVLFCPVAGFWIASDRPSNPDDSPYVAPPDVVFPAIFGGTLSFLRLISKSPALDALDLCAGSGIGAMVLSRSVKRVVSADVTERAAHYAHFNQSLNDCQNLEVVVGDLYDGVKDQTFDRIIAHPPYVPALGESVTWRDGGETGESIARRIIQGLPEYLRPGGTLYMVCLGCETLEGLFEERARIWLGDAHSEFDILLGLINEKSPLEVATDIARHRKDCDFSTLANLERRFQDAQVSRLVYGTIVVRRHAGSQSTPWTSRVLISPNTEGSDLERAIYSRNLWAQPHPLEISAACRPRLSPNLRVRTTHFVVDRVLAPGEVILETVLPFAQSLNLDPLIAVLIAEFNGDLTVSEVYRAAFSGAPPDGFLSLEDFVALVAKLVERGFLILEEPPGQD